MPRKSKEQLIAELKPQLRGVKWILASEHDAIRREYLHRKVLTVFWADFFGVPVEQFVGWRASLGDTRKAYTRSSYACTHIGPKTGRECGRRIPTVDHPKAFFGPGCGGHGSRVSQDELKRRRKADLMFGRSFNAWPEADAHIIAYGTDEERHALIGPMIERLTENIRQRQTA